MIPSFYSCLLHREPSKLLVNAFFKLLAINQTMQLKSHDSIYTDTPLNNVGYQRKVNLYYSIPKNGTNKDTGILLIIAGFGGNASSNVYQQMREEFADEYNLVTIQCDYFGYEFMDTPTSHPVSEFSKEKLANFFDEKFSDLIYSNNIFSYNKLLEYSGSHITFPIKHSWNEKTASFNDMSILQAIANINAIFYIIGLLYSKNLHFNTQKIISYGFSQGAYLAYLCNAFEPNIFSLLIDNSAWLYPNYINNPRTVTSDVTDNLSFVASCYYCAKSFFDSTFPDLNSKGSIIDLNHTYATFENKCNIIAYHGTEDTLISSVEKQLFCNSIKNCCYNEIDATKIDEDIFKSTEHGLNADFKKLFRFTMDNLDFSFNCSNKLNLTQKTLLKSKNITYELNFSEIFPKLSRY